MAVFVCCVRCTTVSIIGISDREFNLHPTCECQTDAQQGKQAMRCDDGAWDVWSVLTRLVDWGENAAAAVR